MDPDMDNITSLQISNGKVGTGAEATSGKTVSVHYTGWLYDPKTADHKGKKFDSSKDHGDPFEFKLGAGQVIRGWDQGVAGMKVGGLRTLVIPSELGYGARGAGGDGDATAVRREVLDPGAEFQRNTGMLAHGFQQHGLQVAAMDDPIGRAIAFGSGGAERRPRQHPRRLRVHDPKLLGGDHVGPQLRPQAKRKQDA